ncbi:hypothetical protein [Actinoplanes sp. ATCC 53533]|uniref:hypothetical protein n=1 Tax=Actinoplanes sp. ATCC 53533 TaxID=1288362 RepID=UPI000F76891C|nr:hypothetical protein [Actinoplanes sp. ATCC 53533]
MREASRYTRRPFIAAAAALAMVAAAIVQTIGVTPAAAATIPVGSVQVVTATSGLTPGSSKTITAVCTSARPFVLGGGFTTTGTHIVVSELQPIDGASVDSYRVTAGFDEVGTSGSWNLLVYAYCSSTAPGWQLVPVTSTTTSNSFNQVIATCPSGKAVVGTGGRINGGAGQVELVTQGIGSVGPNRMSAGGLEDITGFSGSWSVTGYAVCVTYTSSLDIRLVSNQTASDNTITKNVTATCPSGMRLTGSAIWASVPGNAINLRPNNSSPTNVAATARNDSGSGSGWDLITYALCAV